MTSFKLEVREVRKEYPGTVALKSVSLGFEGGKVHALLGKNGAGKSTLVKILAGATEPTSGQVLVDGNAVRLRSPREAFALGIATVYQELSLVPELSVGENILFGRLPHRGIAIDWPQVFQRAEAVLEGMKVRLDVRQKTSRLGVAQQQIVEIAKAMSYQPKVLMLDEPTSALAHGEAQNLFDLIRNLAARGVAIVYISHRLQELKEIADVMSVLRDGELVGTTSMEGATPATIAHLMFGEIVQKERPDDLRIGEENALEVRNLTRKGVLHDISFSLKKGEILGIAGMLGSGRSELLMSLFGAEKFDSGEIAVDGNVVLNPTPQAMKKLGLGLAPEDRKRQGLVQMLSTRENISLAALGRLSAGGVMSPSKQRAMSDASVRDLQIKAGDVRRPVSSLSGGNQQKVVVGKWLNTQPKILLFDEPTRGIDVQAKQQIFQIIWDFSRRGISSIIVSSELEELLEVCHRVLIMRGGRIVGEVRPEGLTIERLLELCIADEKYPPKGHPE